MEPIRITVPVPDSPIFWVVLATFSLIIGFRFLAGIVSKFF